MIVAAALAGLVAIYRPGFMLAKAGVMVLELQPDSVRQGELDLQHEEVKPVEARHSERLMTALDALNLRYGRGTVLLASSGLAGSERTWEMKQARLTPGYTTCWAEMPVVLA